MVLDLMGYAIAILQAPSPGAQSSSAIIRLKLHQGQLEEISDAQKWTYSRLKVISKLKSVLGSGSFHLTTLPRSVGAE